MAQDTSRIELSVSQDSLSVIVKSFNPPQGREGELYPEDITSELNRLGVQIQPDQKQINNILLRAWSGSPIQNIPVLTSELPRKKGKNYLQLLGNPAYPVFKGTVIGELTRASKDAPGWDVFGRKVKPDKLGPEYFREPTLGSGCVQEQGTSRIVAKGYGLVQMEPAKVDVKPLFRIIRDKSRIVCIVFHLDYQEQTILKEHIQQALLAMKVEESMVDMRAITTALDEAKEKQSPQIAVAARGRPPQHGRDGYFEPSPAVKSEEIEIEETEERIDFKDRSVFKSVPEGTVLGSIQPPTQGQPGRDVFGNHIPAQDGQSYNLNPGENVRYDESTGALIAEASGIVIFEKNQISVRESLRIQGDVDYSTGNIKLDKGSVEIMGTVKEGFQVKCPEHVVVNKNVEEARIIAGKNVEIRGGIVMKNSGQILTKGNLNCKFAENATLQVQGTLTFASNLINCRVICRAKVLAKGKGIVMGGTINAEKGMEVKQLGSDYGVQTEVHLGLVPEKIQSLLEKKQELVRHKKEIQSKLNTEDMSVLSKKNAPQEEKDRIQELLNTNANLQERIENTNRLLEERREEFKKAQEMVLKVKNTVYPGTIVHISGKTLRVDKEIKSCTIFYDPSQDKVTWK